MSNYLMIVDGGEEQVITTKEALILVGHYQMQMKHTVREMTWSNGVAHIVLKNKGTLELRPAPEDVEVEEWSTTRTSTKMHRFNPLTNRSRCNKSIYAYRFLGGYFYQTYTQVKGYKNVCARCEKTGDKA